MEARQQASADRGPPAAAGPEQSLGVETAAGGFRRYDQNSDGALDVDEIAEPLAMELDRDADQGGLIYPKEPQAGYAAPLQQETAESDDDFNGHRQDSYAASPSEIGSSIAVEEAGQKPIVYRAGNLPKELPSWFVELDTDRDGQIGLYEWKASGWPLEEFQWLDRNDDGFLTIKEVLHPAIQAGNQYPTARTGQHGSGGSAPD